MQYRPQTKCKIPAIESAITAAEENSATAPSVPTAAAAMKNNGTPIGTVIAIACNTDPVSTPRRTLALFKAKVAADRRARNPPSTCHRGVSEALYFI